MTAPYYIQLSAWTLFLETMEVTSKLKQTLGLDVDSKITQCKYNLKIKTESGAKDCAK